MGLIENISDLIKYQIQKRQALRDGARVARLEKPLQSSTKEEKNNYIIHLFTQLVPEKEEISDLQGGSYEISQGNKAVLDKVFDVLDSVNYQASPYVVGMDFSNILNSINPKANNRDLMSYLEKQLIIRFTPKEELKSLLYKFRLLPFCKYAPEIFEKVYDSLDKTDISLILDNIQNSHRVKPQLMRFLIDKGIDITHVLKELDLSEYYRFSGIDFRYSNIEDGSIPYKFPSNKDIAKVLDSYFEMKGSFSKKDISFFNNNLENRLEGNAKIYYSIMVENGEPYSLLLTNTDEIINYLKEFGEKTFALQEKLNVDILKQLIGRSNQSYSSKVNLDRLQKEISMLPDEVLYTSHREKLTEDILSIQSQNQEYDILTEKRAKYKAIPEEQLESFLLSLDNEEELTFILNDYYVRRFMENTLEKLTKDKIIELSKYSKQGLSLLMSNENVSYEDLLTLLKNKALNSTSIYDLVEEHTFNGKINNSDNEKVHLKAKLPLKDIVESYDFKTEDDYTHIFLYFSSKDRKRHLKTWTEQTSSTYPEKENNLEDLTAVAKVLEKYKASEFKTSRREDFNIRANVDIKVLIKVLEEYPDFAKHIEWTDFNSELPKYVDTLIKYPSFSNYVFRHFADRKDLTQERRVCEINYLKGLAKEDKKDSIEPYFYSENIRNEIIDILSKGELSREETLKILSNSHISGYIGGYYIYPNTEEKKDPLQFIKTIDSDGRLLKFYNSLSQEHLDELLKSGVIYGDNMEVSWIQSRFLNNISTIELYKDDIQSLLEKSPNLFYTMNFNLLKTMDPKTIEFLSKYEQTRSLNSDILAYSGTKIGETINLLRDRLEHPEGEIFSFLKLCTHFESEDVAKEFWDDFSPEDAIYLSTCKNHVFSDSIYTIGPKNLRLMKDMFNERESHFDKVINDPAASKEEVLDVYMEKFFSMPYKEVKRQVDTYGSDLPNIIKRYTSKKELSDKEKIELYSLKHIEFLKEIINISDTDTLRKLYSEFCQDESLTKHSLVTKLMIEDYLKAAFNKEKNESLYIPVKEDKIKEVTVDGEKVEVYKPKDKFNMLITVVGAYVQNSKLGSNPKQDWNDPYKNTSQDICTSVIGNDNLSMALNDNNLKFGFINVGEGDIRSEAPYDLSSNANAITVDCLNRPKFRTIQSIKDNVRTGHSEHLLERNFEGEDGKYYKRQPDYIISINKITKQDKKAAKDFGIPIILLDTKEIAKRESIKIEKLKGKVMTQYENEPKLNPNALEELITKYHNNFSGLITLDKKSIKKNLNPKQMESYLITLASSLKEIGDEEGIKKFNEILTCEEEKREDAVKDFIPFEFASIRKALDIEEKELNTAPSIRDQYKVDITEGFVQNTKDIQGQVNRIYGER